MSAPPPAPWEDLDAEDDPPPPLSGGILVDKTPLTSYHKQALYNEKTPLISHKSSSGLSELGANSHARPIIPYKTSTVKEEDDDRSISSVASVLSWSTASSIVTLSTQYLGNFKTSLLIPFTDETGSPGKICAGLAALFSVGITLGLIMPKDEHLSGAWYPTVSSVLGYTYFLCWSVCFYPQVILNYKRQSTTGLSHDFAVLNFLGWACYGAYECAMYLDDNVIRLYRERFKSADNTVQSNDVAFALHALVLATIYIAQILYYGNGYFKMKRQTWFLLLAIVTPSVVVPILISTGILRFDYWLDYFYMLSFLKISCTMTKYTKQVWFNIERKSTRGWNIWYNFLECVGGTLSMLQVVLDSANMNDWTGVTGNMAKFALGFLTISFDVIFFLQHYLIYPHDPDKDVPPKAEHDIENVDINLSPSFPSTEDLSVIEPDCNIAEEQQFLEEDTAAVDRGFEMANETMPQSSTEYLVPVSENLAPATENNRSLNLSHASSLSVGDLSETELNMFPDNTHDLEENMAGNNLWNSNKQKGNEDGTGDTDQTSPTCTCYGTFGGNPQQVEFYLPQMAMVCTCGATPPSQASTKEDPLALENILRPWQVTFLDSLGIHTATEFLQEARRSKQDLARALRKWRKQEGYGKVTTKMCQVAIHVWSKPCRELVEKEETVARNGMV